MNEFFKRWIILCENGGGPSSFRFSFAFPSNCLSHNQLEENIDTSKRLPQCIPYHFRSLYFCVGN